MKTIRHGSFETNSSSTHAIVIPKRVKEEDWGMEDSLDYKYDFGREECRLVDHWDEKLAYTYMILKDFEGWTNKNREIKITKDTITDFKKKINNIYKEVEQIVKYKPRDRDARPNDIFEYIDNKGEGKLNFIDFVYLNGYEKPYPYVDHCEDFGTNGFLDKILTDDEYLKKFIFNTGSYITIGGDEYRGYNIKTIGFEYDYEDGDHRMNEKGELPPKEWLDERGRIKERYWNRYWDEYTLETGEFWDKLRKYEKENDVFLKGN